MQRFFIRIARWMETIISELNWICCISSAILHITGISTYLYRTTSHWQEWTVFIGFILRGIILLFVLTALEYILLSLAKEENRTAILSREEAEKKKKTLEKLTNLLAIAGFLNGLIGQLFRENTSCNLWTVSVRTNSFFIWLSLMLCQFIYLNVYDRLIGKKDNHRE